MASSMIPPLVPPSNSSTTMKTSASFNTGMRKARTSSVASVGSIGGASVTSVSSCPKQQMIRTSSKADSPYMDIPTSQSRRARRINSGWSAIGSSKTSPENNHKIRDRHCPKELKANSLGGALGKYTFQVLKKTSKKNKKHQQETSKITKDSEGICNDERRRSSSVTSHGSESVDITTGRHQRLVPPVTHLPPMLNRHEKSLSATTFSTQGTSVTPTSTNTSTGGATNTVATTATVTATSPTILFPPTIPEQQNNSSGVNVSDRELSIGDWSNSVYFDASEEELSQLPQQHQTHRTISSLSLRDSGGTFHRKFPSAASYPYLTCTGFVKDATPSMEDTLSDYGLTLFAPLDGAPLRPQPVVLMHNVAPSAPGTGVVATSPPPVTAPLIEVEEDESFVDALPSVCTGTVTTNSNVAVSPDAVFRKSEAVPIQQHNDDDDDIEDNSYGFSSSLPQHIVAPTPTLAEDDGGGDRSSDRGIIHHSSSYHSGNSGMVMNECLFPVDVVAEPQDVMEDCPRLLSDQVMQYLTEEGLPVILKMRRWVRAYSLARDGDSFEMMMTLVSPHKFSLLVVKTTRGEVFGGFVDAPWDSGKAFGFYGGGQAFLFSLWQDPNFNYEEANDEIRHVKTSPVCSDCGKRVTLYNWTGANTYFQVCDETKGSFAMGGGGASGEFGLCVEDCFWKGSTGRCDTFGNAPLAEQSQFEIVDFEVYGFWF